ncbi:MAG: hypothetical protein NUW08_04085 [Candidatus Uhrbacteria bacterium]|nr:hypothetical protein [Candidatus Uhrbacteria bacterium]
MRRTATRTLIEEIYERERVAAARVSWPAGVKDRSDPTARRSVLRSLFRAEVDTVRTWERWATCPVGVPAARMMLRMQPLLVNIQPMKEDTFVRTHGMTPRTMAELVRDGLLVVNLHAFESDAPSFKQHHMYAGELGPLLRLKRGCRIMYARRDAYFKLIGWNRDSAVNEGGRLFKDALTKLLAAADARELIGIASGTPKDATNKVAENWSYLRMLGESDDNKDLRKWMESVPAAIQSSLRATSQERGRTKLQLLLRSLNAWKHLRASVQVKAFEGTLVLSIREAEAAMTVKDGGHLQAVSFARTTAGDAGRFHRFTRDEICTLSGVLAEKRELLESANDDLARQGYSSTHFNDLLEAQRAFDEAEDNALRRLRLPSQPPLVDLRLFPREWPNGRRATVGRSYQVSFGSEGQGAARTPTPRPRDNIHGLGKLLSLDRERAKRGRKPKS